MHLKWGASLVEHTLSAVVFYLCIVFSQSISPASGFQSVFWPLGGVALAVLLLRGHKHLVSLAVASTLIYLPNKAFSLISPSYSFVTLAILLPVAQALLGYALVTRYCDRDLWVFSDSKKLLRLIAWGGVVPSVFSVLVHCLAIIFFLPDGATYGNNAAFSIFFGNICSVAVLTPCLLLIGLKTPLLNNFRKIRVVIPIVGLFGVAAVGFGALYFQLRGQLELEHRQQLNLQKIEVEQRIKIIYEHIHLLRTLLLDDPINLQDNFKFYAQKIQVAHRILDSNPDFFSVGLLKSVMSNTGEVENYILAESFPKDSFPQLKSMPLATDVKTLMVLKTAASRAGIVTLPNFNLVKEGSGSLVAVLILHLYDNDQDHLLAAVVDVSNLIFSTGAKSSLKKYGFIIEDVQTSRTVYDNGAKSLLADENNIRYQQSLEFGNRVWRLSAVYDAVLIEGQLYDRLLLVSIIALLIITVFTLLILNVLVAAQSLESTVRLRSNELEEERSFLDAIFENIPLFLYVKDACTRKYLRVNKYTDKMMGLPVDQYIGKTAYDLFDVADAQRRSAGDVQALQCNGPLTIGEELLRTPLGDRYLFTRKTVINDSEGKPKYILGMSEDITQKKSHEETLDNLVESLPMSLLVLDSSGVIVYGNSSVKCLVDVDILQSTIKDVLPDCNFSVISAMLNDSDDKARPIVAIAKVCNKQDRWVPVEVSFKRTIWNDQQQYLVLIADISDRISAQKSLRDSENQLRLLMANLGEGVCGIDPLGNVTYANLAACNLLGYNLADITHSNFYQSIFCSENDGGDPVFLACSLGQITRSLYARFIRENGEIIPVEYVCTPLISETDRNVGAVVVFNNIQERLEYQANLERRNELIALGVDAAGLGTWEWHSTDNKVLWSTNLYQILGMPEGAFSGLPQDIEKIIHPNDLNEVRVVDEYARRYLEVTDFCCRLIRHDGQVIWVTGKYRYFTDEDGNVIRSRGVLWDSTDETRLQRDNYEKAEALRRSNKELDDFAHIASHDLKEPLRGIANYSAFLQEDYSDKLGVDGNAMLQSIHRLTQHMERLISDLLNYSRLGRTEMAFSQVDVDQLIVPVLESLLPRLEELDVGVCYLTPMPTLYCDGVRLKEVFRNFISNAMKYNKSPTKIIELGCEVKEDEFIFYVADNGIGIAPEFQQKIFEVFKRLHGNADYGGGSGIGLSIVQKVIAQHRGRLWLESDEGQGSTFYFTIPTTSGH